MGLGAYLAASTERKHYSVEEKRERAEVAEKPQVEEEEIYEIMRGMGWIGAVCGWWRRG